MTADPTNARPAAERVPALDGLRGIAILLVVIYHFYIFTPITRAAGETPNLADRAVAHLMGTGWMGVDLFFVLSGFLITGILLESKSGPGYFRNFYARRVLRIFPVYYGFLFVLIFVLPLISRFDGNADLAELRDHQGWYWTYLVNVWSSIDPGTQGGDFRNAHLWSLAIEEQFYLVWPAIVLLLGRRQLLAFSIAAFAGALVCRVVFRAQLNEFGAYFLMPSRMDGFAAGALVALLSASELRRLSRFGAPAALLAALALATIFLVERGLHPYDLPVQTAGFSCVAILFGAVLLMVRGSRAGSPGHVALSWAPLRFFGKYSYAMYVFHIQMVVAINRLLIDADATPGAVGGLEIPARLLYSAALTAATAAAAWLSWQLWERHFLRLKERFRPRSTATRSKPAPGITTPD